MFSEPFSLFTVGQSLSTLFFLKQFYCIRTEFLFESEILNIFSVMLLIAVNKMVIISKHTEPVCKEIATLCFFSKLLAKKSA